MNGGGKLGSHGAQERFVEGAERLNAIGVDADDADGITAEQHAGDEATGDALGAGLGGVERAGIGGHVFDVDDLACYGGLVDGISFQLDGTLGEIGVGESAYGADSQFAGFGPGWPYGN